MFNIVLYILANCRACEPEHGVCSFPSAHVQLTRRNQLLKFGQKYRVYVNLEMPESPKNKELGNTKFLLFSLINEKKSKF